MMALDAGLRDILHKLQSDITLTVQLTYLLPILRQKRLVTEAEFQQLSDDGKESSSEKNGKLIKIIIGKGEDAFDLFVQALQEEQEHLGHSSLAKRLSNEQSQLKSESPSRGQFSRSKTPVAPAPVVAPKPNAKPQYDSVGLKYTLTVQGQSDPSYPLVLTADEKMMKQINGRLSNLERDVKAIKEVVNNTSLEVKIGRAIESIENKLERFEAKLADFVYSQTESVYYTSVNENSSSRLQDKDKAQVYAADNNEYIYETIPEASIKGPVARYIPQPNTGCDDSDGPYRNIRTVKQPMTQQFKIEFLEEEKLADGKSGEIWLGVNKRNGSKIVIKKPISKEIFIQERNALTRISHSNVICLLDCYVTQSSVHVLIFEYAENSDLLYFLKSSGSSFSTLKLLEISASVACGMSELEKKSIIHCDVRARSILIDRHCVCKVASFSKARCLQPGEVNYTPPSNTSVSLPIKWAAPEILSKRNFSIKSDIWAFAVLLSEVFSQGSTPYPSMDNAKVKANVRSGIKMAQPNACPYEVYEVMKHCLEFHAENRPSFAFVHQQLIGLYSKMSETSSSGSDSEDL